MKEPQFKVTVRVTPESSRALAKARAGQHNGVIWLCNAVIALCTVCLAALRSVHAIWMAALLALLLMHVFLRVPLTAWWLYSTRNEAVDKIHLSFDDEGIRVYTRVETSMIRYEAITGLREDRKYLMITIRQHTPLVVGKAEVPDGRAAALADFLKVKTGLDVRPFRK